MQFKRSSGVLLHPTSLPGRYGIGDLGPEAFRWVDFLNETGTGLWQVLPLGPTGYADSPYQCFSALAGNPYLISPDGLVEEGFLEKGDLETLPDFPKVSVNYGEVIPWKLGLLDSAYRRFKKSGRVKPDFEAFCEENRVWLEDYALFMALKDRHDLKPWVTWGAALRGREPGALKTARKELSSVIDRQRFYQFIFFRQWQALREAANHNGIRIIGDMPIYVAHDSSEVWASPELFHLGGDGRPTVVAGVPPDYFSATGQLWGNPIYRWEMMAERGYPFWIDRMRMALKQVDIVRLDHFRGFAGYYQIPGTHSTAEHGEWMPGPGLALFQALRQALGDLPIIAEDLGHITPDVFKLRDTLGFPGMKIFQFGLEGGMGDPFLPHNYPENCVAYTGTHDNETSKGWYHHARAEHQHFAREYLNSNGSDIAWRMIERLWESAAVFTIAPMQDFLGLGDEGRMNVPGTTDYNWRWRMEAGAIHDDLIEELGALNRRTGRAK